jgi:hypothetical protein
MAPDWNIGFEFARQASFPGHKRKTMRMMKKEWGTVT